MRLRAERSRRREMTFTKLVGMHQCRFDAPFLCHLSHAKQRLRHARHRRHDYHRLAVHAARNDLSDASNDGRVLNRRAAKFHDDHGFWFIPCEPVSIASDSVDEVRVVSRAFKAFRSQSRYRPAPTKEAPRKMREAQNSLCQFLARSGRLIRGEQIESETTSFRQVMSRGLSYPSLRFFRYS